MIGNDINVRIGATDATGTAFRSAEMRIKSLAGMAKGMAGAFGVALGARALVGLARQAIDYGSAISDAAVATNTNTEALQVLRYQATQTGASVEQLDKALIQSNKAAVDAANGSKSAANAFQFLGIHANSFINLPTEQKLELLASRMAQSTDKNRAAAAVMDIIGTKNAPKLMEMLQRLGVEGYGKLAEEAKKAGQVMDEDTIKRLDDAGDAIDRFKTRTTILTGETLGFWMKVGEKGFKAAAQDILDGSKKLDQAASKPISVGGIGMPDFRAYDSFYKAGIEYRKYMDRLNAQDRSKDAMRAEMGLSPIDRSVFESIKSFGDLWAAQMDASVDRTAQSLGIIRGDMTATQVHWMSVAKGIEGYTDTMANNMTDAIMTFAQTGKMEFKSFANAVIQDMVRIMITESITRPIAGAFTGVISSGIGAMFGGGGAAGGAAVAGAAAAGGPVYGGRSYLVGEKGPEIMTTRSNGSVIPNDEISGGNVIINFSITAMDSASVSQHLQKHKAEISGIVESAYARRGKKGPLKS